MRNSTFVPDAPHRLRPLERLRLRSLIVFPTVPQAGLHIYSFPRGFSARRQ
jgi:hypothetical protein